MATGDEKYRRMALRRDCGNRVSPEPVAMTNKSHGAYLVAHACFLCRKSFKKPHGETHVCPQCRGKMHWMGRAFQPPSKDETEQWRKVQMLFAFGFRFHRHAGEGCAPLPSRLREVRGFVGEHREHPLRVAEEDLSLLPDGA